MWSEQTRRLIQIAIEEDLGAGDLTAALLPEPDRVVVARVTPRESGVICGLSLGPEIASGFGARLGASLSFEPLPNGSRAWQDGDRVAAGQAVAELRGPSAAVLSCERTLLNFLTRLSGVASLTRRYVDAARAASATVQVLDTRKTVPGWRELDKYAVRCGGGVNHRSGLYDAVLIKDNHLAGVPLGQLAGHVRAMLARLTRPAAFIEVEIDALEQLEPVCSVVGVGLILLDNFPLDGLRQAVARRDALGLRGRVLLEASGGVTLETIGAVAATGVDRISVGALTHSAVGLDVGLDC